MVWIVEFLGIKTVMTPPAISILIERGVTSRRSKSLTKLEVKYAHYIYIKDEP